MRAGKREGLEGGAEEVRFVCICQRYCAIVISLL